MMAWFATLGLSVAPPLLGALALLVCHLRGCWTGVWIVALVGVIYVGASYWPLLGWVPAKPQNTVRLVFLNALIEGPDRDAQGQDILRQQPDILAVVEADPDWQRILQGPEFGAYPYRVLHKVGLREGRIIYDDHIALASRWPLEHVGTATGADDGLALYKVMAPQPFHVFVIHPMAPVFAEAVPLRNAFLRELAAMKLPEKTLVIGDFNTVPWDPAMGPLWRRSDIKRYFSWLPTFRRDVPAVPIDHMLATPDVGIKTLRRWSDGQSDHLGLIVDFNAGD